MGRRKMSLERDKKKLKRLRLFDIQLKGQKVIGRKALALSQQPQRKQDQLKENSQEDLLLLMQQLLQFKSKEGAPQERLLRNLHPRYLELLLQVRLLLLK